MFSQASTCPFLERSFHSRNVRADLISFARQLAKGYGGPGLPKPSLGSFARLLVALPSLASQTYPAVMPRATFVISSLRAFVRDQDRAKHRGQVRRILEEPPSGSA
jgi:hypothetical protein